MIQCKMFVWAGESEGTHLYTFFHERRGRRERERGEVTSMKYTSKGTILSSKFRALILNE